MKKAVLLFFICILAIVEEGMIDFSMTGEITGIAIMIDLDMIATQGTIMITDDMMIVADMKIMAEIIILDRGMILMADQHIQGDSRCSMMNFFSIPQDGYQLQPCWLELMIDTLSISAKYICTIGSMQIFETVDLNTAHLFCIFSSQFSSLF
jgi:hypothetical protein